MQSAATQNIKLGFTATFFKAVAVMALPILELVALRHYFHDVLQLRIGFPGFTDYELFLPAPLGFLAFFVSLETAQITQLRFQKLWFGIHSIVFSLFILATQSGISFEFWSLGLILTTLTAFLIFWNPKEIVKNPNFWAIGPSCLMVFSVVLYMKYGSQVWHFAIHHFEGLLKGLLAVTGNEIIKVSVVREQLHIYHPLVRLRLGQGCGGFDGILFFLAAFSIFAPLNWRCFSWKSWLGFAFLGAGLFLLLNILRILILFSVGVWGSLLMGQEAGISLMIGFFHVHLGYLLYAAGMCLYFKTLSEIAQKRKLPIKKEVVAATLPIS